MASNDGDEGESSYSAALRYSEDEDLSLVSAADWRIKSRLRTPRRTTTDTPTRSLFPENIDELAPGMTPTSKYSGKKRRSTAAFKTPQKSTPRRPRVSSAYASQLNTPVPIAREPRANHNKLTPAPQTTPHPSTSTVAATSRSAMKARQSNAGVKRTPARTSYDSGGSSSKKQKTNKFAGWGRAREESPMELLRKLFNAPGRLWSPTDGDDTSQSISQQLENVTRPSVSEDHLTPKARRTLAQDVSESQSQLDVAKEGSSSVDKNTGRLSVADTSVAASEAGLARRAARQSHADNTFSDLLARDTSAASTKTIPFGFDQSFDIQEDDEDEPVFASSRADRSFLDESTRFESGADTSVALSTRRRFEDVDLSQSSEEEAIREGDNEIEDEIPRDTTDVGNEGSRSEVVLSDTDANFDESNMSIERSLSDTKRSTEGVPDERSFHEDESSRFPADDEPFLTNEEQGDEAGKGVDESGREAAPADDVHTGESESEEEEYPDESKQLRAARVALLRKRRARKKAKRYSTLTGNLVPSLPSTLVRQLFKSFTTPSTGIATTSPTNKSKVKIENPALEAVEDL
ncbi:hypothetical protein CBS101457_000317 [Exobasidium rhododendri]|nr:hypothetical protein CBS101457_000317 [Exobasidium rhododendri]